MQHLPRVTILWTGGWDSTFRLIQLAQYNIEIQPVYVIDPDRKSLAHERRVMELISKEVSARFPAKLLDIRYYEKSWIFSECRNDEISAAFRRIREKYTIGIQYEWFALLCSKLNLQMESAIIDMDNSNILKALYTEGELVPEPHEVIPARRRIRSKGGNNAIDLVFGNLILPVINITKAEAGDIARQNGWIDILELSWFCHTPINNKPCGLCVPCCDAMESGMGWRLPKEAHRRYRHKEIYRFARKVCRKLKIPVLK